MLIEVYGHTLEISIHAPVKGATQNATTNHISPVISIHAPVKGATTKDMTLVSLYQISIHAPVKGATRGKSLLS